MTIINSVEYSIHLLHGRFMVVENLNGQYDSFRRAQLADMEYFIGEDYATDRDLEATYLLTQGAGGKWTLTTLVADKTIREEIVPESKVRHLFTVLTLEFRIRTLGEDVETNYEYRKAS